MELPEPDCAFGYPFAQLRGLLDEAAFARFEERSLYWTVPICEGEACIQPHGGVVFVRGFVRSLPVSRLNGRAE